MSSAHDISPEIPDAALAARYAEHYGELRRMARARLRRHETFTLLDTTSLVHESFLRLSRVDGVSAEERAGFLAYAAQVMRSVIVDTARARLAQRRGAGAEVLPLDEELQESLADAPAACIVQVHEALLALQASEPRLADVVALEYFAGMSEPEVAACLGLSERTVRRDIARARLLLRALLS
jgi:RNA polymerase sigma factor (TIGR02999 family)